MNKKKLIQLKYVTKTIKEMLNKEKYDFADQYFITAALFYKTVENILEEDKTINFLPAEIHKYLVKIIDIMEEINNFYKNE